MAGWEGNLLVYLVGLCEKGRLAEVVHPSGWAVVGKEEVHCFVVSLASY